MGFPKSDEVKDGIAAEAVWSYSLIVAVPAHHPLLRYKRLDFKIFSLIFDK